MALIFNSTVVELLAVLLTIIIGCATYLKWSFGYWKRRNFPHLEPTIPFGNMENPFTRKHYVGDWFKMLYDQLKQKGLKQGGFYFFSAPAFMPVHPEVIQKVIQKDFKYFADRGFYYNEKDDPLSAHLIALCGQRWGNLRTILTPTLTSGKIKMMFDTFMQCGHQMQDAMEKFNETKEPVDIKEVLARYATDIIGSCAFGLEFNSFKSPDAEFRKHGKEVLDSKSNLRAVMNAFAMLHKEWARKLGVTILNQDATRFFMKVIKDTVKYRENNNSVRKDMLQLLIDLKSSDGDGGTVLTIEEIAAQAFVFFIAGFETSSTTMTFCLYELATNADIQGKAREEIDQILAKHDGKVTYDAIMDMKYMGQVVDETLRKYPPLSFLLRECVKDYQIPDTDVVIKKGMRVFISVLGLHRDPDHFPDPEKFDPERFSDDNKNNINPFAYLPFGEGPRICIGIRFAMMQIKIALTLLLKNYKFSVNKQTAVPVVHDRFSFFLTTEGKIWLDMEKV